jgi:hypothetical protein
MRVARQGEAGLFQVDKPRFLESLLISSLVSVTSHKGLRTPSSLAALLVNRMVSWVDSIPVPTIMIFDLGMDSLETSTIFIFSFAAINTGNNLLYLILAVMISILIASFWLSEMVLNDLNLSRRLPESVFAGEEFSVVYELLNQKTLSRKSVSADT